MRVFAFLYWLAIVGTLGWCAHVYVNVAVSAHYHPMAALGDRFNALRSGAVAIPLFTALAILILWLLRRPLKPHIYILGFAPLILAIALTFSPRIESGYEQEYWLGDQKHSIPWAYGPYNGQSQEGGKFFLVRAWGTDFSPFYQNSQHPDAHFILGKAIAFNFGNGGPPREGNCVPDRYNFRCAWQSGSYVYSMSIDADSVPDNPRSHFQAVEDLLNSFAVDD